MELTLKQIEEQLDVPLKSYWLFVYSKIRSGVWEELFKNHLDKYYPENPDYIAIKETDKVSLERDKYYIIESGSLKGKYRSLITTEKAIVISDCVKKKGGDLLLNDKTHLKEVGSIRNSKRTNFPRTVWQKEELSWLSYYEGVLILSQIYKSITIDFELVYEGREIHKFSVPVTWEILESPEGENIKHKGRVDGQLVVDPKLDRRYEHGLSYIIREVMRKSKLTRRGLDKLLDVYTSDENNLYTFSTKSKPNIKSSILGTMFKWNITWSNFTRALKVLGYTDLSISINAVKVGRAREDSVISSVAMRIGQ